MEKNGIIIIDIKEYRNDEFLAYNIGNIMQLLVSIKGVNQINLPISYHHIQQSAIYSLIKGDLHDKGYKYEKREYKLFTFGPINGRYTIKNKRISFYNNVSFEFRCLDENVMNSVINNIQEYGLRLGDISYHNVELAVLDHKIYTDHLVIKMISPICVYETDELKYTHYKTPMDEDFYTLIEDNYIRKYLAAYKCNPIEGIVVSPNRVNEKDKYFTKYKNFYIEGWKGEYILEGNPEALDFLYNTGIGSKNSQGFGMFEIIE